MPFGEASVVFARGLRFSVPLGKGAHACKCGVSLVMGTIGGDGGVPII